MTNAAPPRRWFRFSIRTLLLLVAVAAIPAAWVGWQVRGFQERQRLFGSPGVVWSVAPTPSDDSLPLVWRWLGAKPVSQVLVHPAVPDEIFARFVVAFPEAEVHREYSGLPASAGPVQKR